MRYSCGTIHIESFFTNNLFNLVNNIRFFPSRNLSFNEKKTDEHLLNTSVHRSTFNTR